MIEGEYVEEEVNKIEEKRVEDEFLRNVNIQQIVRERGD